MPPYGLGTGKAVLFNAAQLCSRRVLTISRKPRVSRTYGGIHFGTQWLKPREFASVWDTESQEENGMSTVPVRRSGKELAVLVNRNEEFMLAEWLAEMSGAVRRADLIKDSEVRGECARFLGLLREGLQTGEENFRSPAWDKMREMLTDISRDRAQQGFTPSETAAFVLSIKRPIFTRIRQECKDDTEMLGR